MFIVAGEKAFAGMEIVLPGSAPLGLTAANTISNMPAAVKMEDRVFSLSTVPGRAGNGAPTGSIDSELVRLAILPPPHSSKH